MSELIFETALTEEEIEKNFEGIDLFSELMDGLTEALEHSKGKAAADTFTRKRSLPNVDVSRVRSSLHMTQSAFASVLGVSPRTVEAWECGKTNPNPTAKKLMWLIQNDPSILAKL